MPLDLPMCRCKLEPYVPSVEEQAQRNRLEALLYGRPVIEDSTVRRIKNFEKEEKQMTNLRVIGMHTDGITHNLLVRLKLFTGNRISPSAPWSGNTNMKETEVLISLNSEHVLEVLQAQRTSRIKAFVPGIKQVIFNDPATIVIWSDGTKTVVKCQPGETFDEEKGLALAISKKALGNKGNYNDAFKRYIKR